MILILKNIVFFTDVVENKGYFYGFPNGKNKYIA